jgi:hypothetical protein
MMLMRLELDPTGRASGLGRRNPDAGWGDGTGTQAGAAGPGRRLGAVGLGAVGWVRVGLAGRVVGAVGLPGGGG